MQINTQAYALPSNVGQSTRNNLAPEALNKSNSNSKDSAAKSPSEEKQVEDAKKEKQAERVQLLEDQKKIQQLSSRDQEVRSHEAAHIAAAGSYVSSGPTYTYQRGPDGNSYAVGGEVQLDTSTESDPNKALDKAETIQRAALAPAQPSSQDFSVAASAAKSAAQARVDIAVERRDELVQNKQEQEVNNQSSKGTAATEPYSVNNVTDNTNTNIEAVLSSVSDKKNVIDAGSQKTNIKSSSDRAENLYSQQSSPINSSFSLYV